MDATVHLTTLSFRPPAHQKRFPFSVPVVRAGRSIPLDQPVTLLVGENGAGKSTILETLAVCAELPAAGGADPHGDPTLAAARELAEHTRLTWARRTHRGFFLRAEDFFNFSRRLREMRAEAESALRALEAEYEDGSPAELARVSAPFRSTLGALKARYGEDLDAQSHGESFLAFVQARLVPGGLYVLDEPEAALSPLRQLSLMALIADAARQGSQFVIATHSPVLLAQPGARILHLDGDEIRQASWNELEHVRLTRDFLANPEGFLRHL